MTVLPLKITLPYRAPAAWRQQRLLAGHIEEEYRTAVLDPQRLPNELAERAVQIVSRTTRNLNHSSAKVVGCGLLHGDSIFDGADFDDAPEAWVWERIGRCPEIEPPADDPAVLIAAYETWIEEYRKLTPSILRDYAERYERFAISSDRIEDFTDIPWLCAITVPYRVTGRNLQLELGIDTDFDLFLDARRAKGMLRHLDLGVSEESLNSALALLPNVVDYDEMPASEQIVADHLTIAERARELAFTHEWLLARRRQGFELEMKRWAEAHGTSRLKFGIEDGYRMVPVYLGERIAEEMPGAFAYQRANRDGVSFGERVGPSEEALRWRRIVQARLDLRSGLHEGRELKATIVWVRNPPEGMLYDGAQDRAIERDGSVMDPVAGFEAIAVTNWLGRYTLLAAVYRGDAALPRELHNAFVLEPSRYTDADDLPSRITATAAAQDDIPF